MNSSIDVTDSSFKEIGGSSASSFWTAFCAEAILAVTVEPQFLSVGDGGCGGSESEDLACMFRSASCIDLVSVARVSSLSSSLEMEDIRGELFSSGFLNVWQWC